MYQLSDHDWKQIKELAEELIYNYLDGQKRENHSEFYCHALDEDFGELWVGDVYGEFIKQFEILFIGFDGCSDFGEVLEEWEEVALEAKENVQPFLEAVKPLIQAWIEESFEDVKYLAEQEEREKERKETEEEERKREEKRKKFNEAIERNKMSPEEYFKTPYWRQEVRPAVIARDKYCRLCSGTENFNVHHNNYRSWGFELEHLDSVTLLCQDCHKTFHENYWLEREECDINDIIDDDYQLI